MRKPRILIISKRAEVARFFELEAINFGFCVDRIDRKNRKNDPAREYSMTVIDTQTVKSYPQSVSGIVVFVGENEDSDISEINDINELNEIRLSLPVRVSELQTLYQRALMEFYGLERGATNDTLLKNDKLRFSSKNEKIIYFNGKRIALSETESALLKILCDNVGCAVSREKLSAVFENATGNVLDVYMYKLRKKLENAGRKNVITTVRGQGYRIDVDMECKKYDTYNS